MHDVSSGFISTIAGKSPEIIRSFTIGSSDYSNFVTQWPKIGRKWNEIKPQSVTMRLANQLQTFNFLEGTPAQMNTIASVDFGVRYDVSSEETINLFSGKISKINFSKANCSISLTDKIKPFSEVIVGTSAVPLEFISSDYLPSDIAWWLATSHGGLSAIESTSNPDIDYLAFTEWAGIFSNDNIFVNATFDGDKLSKAFRKIGRVTRSTIIVENDKLTFSRYDASSSGVVSVASESMFDFELSIDDADIVNKQTVHANYSVSSRFYQIAIFETSTASVNSYGLREDLEEDPNIWYTNSISALSLAQRVIFTSQNPPKRYRFSSGIGNSYLQIGDVIGVSDEFHGISQDTVRIMSYEVDMEKAKVSMQTDASQLINFFYLDNSSLGLLDQSTNPLA